MEFLVSAQTDIGISKSTNQDSLLVRIANTAQGRISFAVLCDGMGGLSKGEVASATVIRAFDNWFNRDFPSLCDAPIEDSVIHSQWCRMITELNERIKNYGLSCGTRLGTTVVAILITQNRYYLLNVGDSRAYEITNVLTQLTADQTYVAREVALGNMTPEQAERDPKKSVLLQCVGASHEVVPDMFFGDAKSNAVYMLCSDGFRHVLTPNEIFSGFNPSALVNEHAMNVNSYALIELNKRRGERDNISVALIKTV
ncbi:MAG: serine/threonine-protein phosphatase [Clostridia bacterium]|nr:serine/threonine-protein phosphatase [Clostridia bacterium]MBQ9849062.1 serine/threonine-protein phosphatase [Clostridia bacterium]